MKRDDLTNRSDADLNRLASELEEKVFKLRLEHRLGQLKQTADIKKTRHERARILTAIRQRARALREKKEGVR